MVRGDATGDVVFYGKGAGKLPTASAVVADVIDCVKHMTTRKYLYWEDSKPNYVEDFKKDLTEIYVRALDNDEDEAFEKVEKLFGKVTRLSRKAPGEGEIAFVTPLLSEYEIDNKISVLEADGLKILGKIRISDY